uniref:MBD domain-containing protein n=1 Tax=Strigamia maritima TaxID=126957 RepID=T1IHL0_STRMM
MMRPLIFWMGMIRDESDDEISSQAQPLTPVRPAPKRPARNQVQIQDIPPFVSSRRKNAPVSLTLLQPTSSKRGFHRTAVPNKAGWEREEVQRQSGATKGQWDIYFYAPGRRFPIRSRPEIREYCEKTLNVPYNPDEFSWKPTEAPIDTVSPVDTDNEGETQTMTPENYNVDSDPECYTGSGIMCCKMSDPSVSSSHLFRFIGAIVGIGKLKHFAVFEIKHSLTFLCQGKMADVFTPCYFNITQFKEDNAVLSDYNHSQAVVISFVVSFSLKQFGGHCQCHWAHIQGHTSNSQANDKVFHAQFSSEAIAQSCARIEQDRFRRDLAYNSGGSRLLACDQKSRLFYRNSENGFLLIFDRLKHSFATKTVPRTRADHYNIHCAVNKSKCPAIILAYMA